jgi:membrane-bound lytic murein transglycosylase A
LQTPEAQKAYQNYPVPGIRRDRVQRSLKRFRQLLVKSPSAPILQQAVQKEFTFYQAIGNDQQGTVAFTGYFQPIFAASRVPTTQFRYPLYRLPPNFAQWPKPHPTRKNLEGIDGLQAAKGPMKGLELIWLRDRLEAFLVQVQGSARLRLPQGQFMSVGYAGRTAYPYTSLGKELIKDGKVKPEGLTLPAVLDYFAKHPSELNQYLPRNQSFVFFKETTNAPPKGSIKVPVTPERSIATDKSLLPPGALALIQTQMPFRAAQNQFTSRRVNRFVLDQDTGSAIKGPGRVDIYMGTGPEAGDRAGLINTPGRLYYLLLK